MNSEDIIKRLLFTKKRSLSEERRLWYNSHFRDDDYSTRYTHTLGRIDIFESLFNDISYRNEVHFYLYTASVCKFYKTNIKTSQIDVYEKQYNKHYIIDFDVMFTTLLLS